MIKLAECYSVVIRLNILVINCVIYRPVFKVIALLAGLFVRICMYLYVVSRCILIRWRPAPYFLPYFKLLVVLSVQINIYFSQGTQSFKTPLSYYSWTPQSSHRDTFFSIYILFFLQNELLPPSQCMPSQTQKEGMGPLNRKHLLDHLKKTGSGQ